MTKNLATFFSPKSVAIVGASRSAEKVGAIVLKNIINSNFSGKIFPINPNTNELNGIKTYPDVKNLPEIPDLAIIALPSEKTLEALTQTGDLGIKNVVVLAAGFKETGLDGEKLEKELVSICQKHEINLLGPNCLGFVNNSCPINATFGSVENNPGNFRFISQSGAIAASLFDWFKSINLGFNEFITLGNKAILTENDVLTFFEGSEKDLQREGESSLKPIGMYLESISDGKQFLELTTRLTKKNPVFILKPGKTKEAAKAMQSHTGAIACEDAIFEAALNQAGVIRCKTLEDFFDLSKAFAWENPPLGKRVAIISNAGGPAVISADAVISEGLELALFDEKTKQQLAEMLPRAASVLDPVDVMGDALADRFAMAADSILQTNQADSLLIVLTPQIMTQVEKTAQLIGELSKNYQKPIFCSFMGGLMISEGEQILNKYKIPSFRFPERAISAISKMWFWQKQRQQTQQITENGQELDIPEIKEIIKRASSANQNILNNSDSNKILQLAGIPTPPSLICSTIDEAAQFCKENGFPVVLKLSSSNLLHKKDLGGVLLDISNENDLQEGWDKLRREIAELEDVIKKDAQIQIQKQVLSGVEVIAGVKKDPTFGHVVLFGAGGTLTELINDRNLHLLPLSLPTVKKMVEESKIFPLLNGYRGEPRYALEKLFELILKLGKLAESNPEILEIEINPVMVTLNGVFSIDPKVILRQEVKSYTGPKFQTATTLSHEILAGTYHYFVFETETPLTYKPGQYLSVKVSDSRINAYSIAGSEGNKIFILVDTSPGGPGSKFFENLKVGDKMSFLGPFGIFTLKEKDDTQEILFLGTGSGCSPLKCMVEAALKSNNYQIPITFYFGLRNNDDVFWQDYFNKLASEHPNFKFKLSLSKPDQNWQGQIGHITELVKKDYPDTSKCSAYLCGNHAMIEEASEILLSNGCPKEKIYTEKF